MHRSEARRQAGIHSAIASIAPAVAIREPIGGTELLPRSSEHTTTTIGRLNLADDAERMSGQLLGNSVNFNLIGVHVLVAVVQ